jgi:RNA polymerase sigma-70 factor (ECF subfamily)
MGRLDVDDAIGVAAAEGPAAGEPPAADDATLIAQSWDDPGRFGEIFRRHAPPLHRYVTRRLGAAAAEDIVAETFCTAFRTRGRYDVSLPDARPWLWRIATNLVRRHWRSEARLLRALARTGIDPVIDDLADRVAERVTAQAAGRQLAGALAGLSARDRDVLLLVAWGELSYEETARVLRIPVGTVRSRLNRSRRQVRAALGGAGPSGEQEAIDHG